MFIGHFAVGLAAKKAAPNVSLGTLFLASQFMDLIWPLLLLAGIETVKIDPGNTVFTPLDLHDYPISHSLLTVIGWSALFGAIYFGLKRSTRGAIVLGVALFSHWFLDFVTHRPDLPLYPGSATSVGLGLWNSVAGTIIVEGLLFIVGVAIYTRITKAKDKIGSYAFWALIGFFVIINIGTIIGPPPPDEMSLAIVALAQWMFIPWGYWIDRHRESSSKPS